MFFQKLFFLLASSAALIGSKGQEDVQVFEDQEEIVFLDDEDLFEDENEVTEIIFDDIEQ